MKCNFKVSSNVIQVCTVLCNKDCVKVTNEYVRRRSNER